MTAFVELSTFDTTADITLDDRQCTHVTEWSVAAKRLDWDNTIGLHVYVDVEFAII